MKTPTKKAAVSQQRDPLPGICNTHYMRTQVGVVDCLPMTERGTRRGEASKKVKK